MDTANQNSDKQKTYDFCRIEYSFLSSILFLDADEIFHCEASLPKKLKSIESKNSLLTSISQLKLHQQAIQIFLNTLQQRQYEEVLIKRYSVFSLLWESAHINTTTKRFKTSSDTYIDSLIIDATNHLQNCILTAYQNRSIFGMFKCWSNQIKSGPHPKSLDIGNKCPFHWNHLACKINTLAVENNSTRSVKFNEKMYM